MTKSKWFFVITIILTLLFVGCAKSVPCDQAVEMAKDGFWWGLLHGWIAPFAFIGSLFNPNIAIYSIYNAGAWYDFGYVLGIGSTEFSSTYYTRK